MSTDVPPAAPLLGVGDKTDVLLTADNLLGNICSCRFHLQRRNLNLWRDAVSSFWSLPTRAGRILSRRIQAGGMSFSTSTTKRTDIGLSSHFHAAPSTVHHHQSFLVVSDDARRMRLSRFCMRFCVRARTRARGTCVRARAAARAAAFAF